MLADSAFGLLVWPDQGGLRGSSLVVREEDTYPLRSIELPPAADVDSYEVYCDRLVDYAKAVLLGSLQ
jgi:hypothetical protein